MSAAKPKFCAECGAPLAAGAKFCAACGKPSVPASAAKPSASADAADALEGAEEAPPIPESALEPIAPVAAVRQPSGDHHKAKHAGGKFEDPLAHLLDKDDETVDDTLDVEDRLELPDVNTETPKKSLPIAMIAMALLGLLVVGVIAWIASNDELSARVQCNLLGRAEKCITEEDRQAEIERKEKEEEINLMTARYGQFDLNFDPPKETSVLIVQKRYEEDRNSFIARIAGSVPCKKQDDCPANYECTGAENLKKCIVKAGSTGDNRVLKVRKVGDYKQLPKAEDGTSKGVISFVTEEDWKAKHAGDPPPAPLPPPPPPKADEPPPPPAVPPAPPHVGPITWEPKPGRELQLPMTLATLPLLEKEQEDGNKKRLTADDVKKIEEMKNTPKKDADGNLIKDPATVVKTVAVSTWVYEIELSAPGYLPRKVLFYDEPAPPDLDIKKLEKEGWSTRKFKRTPDGKFIMDNASFDLTPTPRVLINRYMQYLQQSKCMKEAPEWKGKPDQGKLDAEDLLWEQLMFRTKEKREIALKNEEDPEFKTWRDLIMKDFKCKKD